MTKALGLFLFLLFFTFQVCIYAQFDKAVEGRLNLEQPIFEGYTIYTIIKDGSCYRDGAAYYYVETIKYIYYSFQRDKLVLLMKYSYSDESIAPDKKFKVEKLSLPIDDQNQALLTAEDGKQLAISVLSDGRLEVSEVKTDTAYILDALGLIY